MSVQCTNHYMSRLKGGFVCWVQPKENILVCILMMQDCTYLLWGKEEDVLFLTYLSPCYQT